MTAGARSRILLLASSLAVFACEEDSPDRPDGGTVTPGPDAGMAAEDATVNADAQPADSTTSPDGSTALQAVLGQRCTPATRIGTVELVDDSGFLSVTAYLSDRPDPTVGPPDLTDSSCGFYDAYDGACSCNLPQICAHDGTCVAPPEPPALSELIVRSTAGEETFPEQSPGVANGQVMLGGRSFSIELHAYGETIALAETELPGMLPNLSGMLHGTYDAPEAVHIEWDPVAGESAVYTNIPINHHVADGSFTECVVAASAGTMHVGQSMLVPLAVSTGLEFQGLMHVKYAALELPAGCLEFRYGVRYYLSLF